MQVQNSKTRSLWPWESTVLWHLYSHCVKGGGAMEEAPPYFQSLIDFLICFHTLNNKIYAKAHSRRNFARQNMIPLGQFQCSTSSWQWRRKGPEEERMNPSKWYQDPLLFPCLTKKHKRKMRYTGYGSVTSDTLQYAVLNAFQYKWERKRVKPH